MTSRSPSKPDGFVQAHQQLKEELGLNHFEGRSRDGLHRHALMAMIAYAFLQHHRLVASRGKKSRWPSAATKSAAVRHAIIASIMRPLRAMSILPQVDIDRLHETILAKVVLNLSHEC